LLWKFFEVKVKLFDRDEIGFLGDGENEGDGMRVRGNAR
jgi:hypothetical protein